MLHFTYADEQGTVKDELCQGDILKRTPALDALLEQVHPHFREKVDYKYFVVLTQSCDLVPRSGGQCKAPYITIAAVRPLSTILNRQIDLLKNSKVKADLPVLTDRSKGRLQEFLTRLLNNNEPGYFYLDSGGTVLETDCCAILAVSIALKAPEHYAKCVEAKVLQLTDTFQAKLGWLVGQMYSRVGTMDWTQSKLTSKISTLLESSVILIPHDAEKAINSAFSTRNEGDGPFSEQEIRDIVGALPKTKQKVLSYIDAVAKEVLVSSIASQPATVVTDAVDRMVRRLDNDAGFTQLIK